MHTKSLSQGLNVDPAQSGLTWDFPILRVYIYLNNKYSPLNSRLHIYVTTFYSYAFFPHLVTTESFQNRGSICPSHEIYETFTDSSSDKEGVSLSITTIYSPTPARVTVGESSECVGVEVTVEAARCTDV